ncbi:glycerol-3-phosphate phosphatase isoform X1 [Ischnura elegans]|uniref:glycerol-3-phosphate phosphatase isoform X1 n=1 Tax=Ischnura elegans TaxID=197161 RepID=UPI001ED896B3|nr:glycerol-3-phosphate phosphatase isoform X1 [Ischnura elegans]
MNSKSSKFMPSLSREHVKKFIDSFDTVLTDCDGVLWVENNAIDGSPALIRRLVDLGKKVFYVTNNSTRNRQDYVEKCRKLGFPAEKEGIIGTAYLVATYLKEINFNKKVFLIGSEGLAKELDVAGIRYTGLGPDVMPEVWSTLRSVEGDIENHLDGEVGAVVVGFDPHFSYPKLIKAASYLSNPDCLYIATNTDERFPVNSRLVYPGTGSLVAAVTACSARSPLVLGKPNPYVADAIAKFHTLDPQRTLMIGDRGNTDILLGTKCGFQTLLVMTGVTSKEELAQWQCSENAEERSLVPDYYVNKLGDLIQFL